jgi:hypothetical protein
VITLTEESRERIETRLADLFEHAINNASETTERAMMQRDHRVGVSDLGHCHEYVRRLIMQEPFTDPRDKMAAWVGSLIGTGFEAAMMLTYPNAGWVAQEEVTVTLPSNLRIPGHPDLYNPHILVDGKTKDGLTVVEREDMRRSNRFQLHLYAHGLIQAGKVDPDGFVVTNAYIDRSGGTARPHVKAEAYDPAVVEEADAWLDDVLYAVRAGEEAEKDPPRDFCARFCEYFTACRLYDTDVSGLLQSPDIVAAAENIEEAQELERRAKKLRRDARAVLDGVSGSTGKHFVRWTNVPGTDTRRGSSRLEVSRIPQKADTDGGEPLLPGGPEHAPE